MANVARCVNESGTGFVIARTKLAVPSPRTRMLPRPPWARTAVSTSRCAQLASNLSAASDLELGSAV